MLPCGQTKESNDRICKVKVQLGVISGWICRSYGKKIKIKKNKENKNKLESKL